MSHSANDELFPIWREPRSIWERTGLTPVQRRVLDVSLSLLLLVFTVGWTYSVIEAIRRGESPQMVRQVGSSFTTLSSSSGPDATFALSALVERLVDWEEVRGVSGAIEVVLREPGDTLRLPDAIPSEAAVAYALAGDSSSGPAVSSGVPGQRPGIWNILLQMGGVIREIPRLRLVTLVPSSAVERGRIGEYRIGEWPTGTGTYAPPRGFVEVTPENMDTPVSTHFQLRDFLTKGQEGVWPKYVVISPRLLDKLELTLQELEAMGHPVKEVFVVSGFRTPWYNDSGGNTQGRAAISRHMYGDAADIAIDNDRNGCMDDLNGDGRVDVQDARVIVAAAESVERKYPSLIGGIGVYRPVPGSHCGMVHIDARGNRARW